MLLLIDTHNHLGCDDFESDRSQIIKNCLALGIVRQIIVSVFSNEWQKDIQLAMNTPTLYAACGIHPMYIPVSKSGTQQALYALQQLIANKSYTEKLCAIGEIGLDYYIEKVDKSYQHNVFEHQLTMATLAKKPVLLHIRRAHADAIKLLKASQFTQQGIVHAFSGSYEEAKEYIKLGFKIGLGGAGTYPQAHRMHRVLQKLPLESIVLETDAPDLSPVSQQGKRNSPEYLPEICLQLAKIKHIDSIELANATTNNVCDLFNWSIDDIKKASIH